MAFTVKERGGRVATFRYVQVRLMETLAAWVPTTPEMEGKLLFGAHIWDVAQHADALGKRTYELRLPLQFSLRPAVAYTEVLTELSEAKETPQRIAGFYDLVLSALVRRHRDYLDRTDALMDAPTVRVLERILDDEARMLRESHELRHQLPQLRLMDQTWLNGLAGKETAVEDLYLSDAA